MVDQQAQIRSMFNHEHIFFSYQVHPEEKLKLSVVNNVDLVFMHDYENVPSQFKKINYKFCPLNGAESITDACGKCRRCF